MSHSLRLSEKWFRLGLWLVALVFASFLIGLGGTVVDNLPKVEARVTLEDFVDKTAAKGERDALREAGKARQAAEDQLQQEELKLKVAQANSAAASETFYNWLATRHVTQRPEQDPELVSRTRELDALKVAERAALARVEGEQQALLDARQGEARHQAGISRLEAAAGDEFARQQRSQELRVFLYRLALTLPLLAAAGWLFANKRQSMYWPFVWGFILFALFAFFVELVPYLPSYGGYVRYAVGILVTALVGRQAIVALNHYLERQKRVETLPDQQRRQELSYDTALARLAKKVCPGCERPVDPVDAGIDFCPHCGICINDHCVHCNRRKSAFSPFCPACGTAAPQTGDAA
jgi:hypothetical protein